MYWTRLRTCAVFAIVVVCQIGAATTAKLVAFPSSHKAISSDSRFAITNLDSDNEPFHTLFIEDGSKHEMRKLLEYSRSAEVLWNPNNVSFAVNHYEGSNVSEAYVYSTDPAQRRIDVQNRIFKEMKTAQEKASVTENHHVYSAAVRWLDSNTLVVKVWGHGGADPNGFTRYYNYRLR